MTNEHQFFGTGHGNIKGIKAIEHPLIPTHIHLHIYTSPQKKHALNFTKDFCIIGTQIPDTYGGLYLDSFNLQLIKINLW